MYAGGVSLHSLKVQKTTMSKKTLVTHSSRFHADDVFATAALQIVHDDQLEIVRSRDADIIAKADIVIDVGGVYNPEVLRFDHHQNTFEEVRDNGIPYASFGLIWRHFGEEICGGSQEVADILEKKIVQPIDASDNGVQICDTKFDDIHPYIVSSMLYSFMPSWKEDTDLDDAFKEAVDLAKKVLEREIIRLQDSLEAKDAIIKCYESAEDKRIIIFGESDVYDDMDIQHALTEHEDPLLYIRYRHSDDNWSVKAVRSGEGVFGNRITFPEGWGGLQNAELQKASGVDDAVFCHRACFMCVAKSLEGAVAMAQKALNQKDNR
jgi:uncharacterized UPF0160 family protein